jgi:uncharacterized protein
MQARTQAHEPQSSHAGEPEVGAPGLPRSEMVTLVIQHAPRAEAQTQYEAWLKKIIPVAARFPGHRGVSVIRPTPGTRVYTVAVRFDALRHADDWSRSAARRELVEEVAPLLQHDEHVETVTGLEFWFAPDAAPQKQARPYKQFLLTLSVIVPLTLLVPWGMQPLFRALPWPTHWFVQHVLVNAAIVGLITYVVMPRYVRRVGRWLYR